MARVLRRLPYVHSAATRPPLLKGRARTFQIVIHLGIAPLRFRDETDAPPPPTVRPVPVVLDSGLSHGLLLRTSHVRHLSNTPTPLYTVDDFTTTGDEARLVRRGSWPTAESSDEGIPTRRARVWLYPNRPGSWEIAPTLPPVPLVLTGGIMIAPRDDLTPPEMRSPLLGLRGLDECGLVTLMHRQHLDAWVGRPWWWELLAAARAPR